MLFGIDDISTFANWPSELPEPTDRTFSELLIEQSNGDLLCTLEMSTSTDGPGPSDHRWTAACPIFISAPIVYSITVGDIMSQQFIEKMNKNDPALGVVFEVKDSKYAQSLMEAEPGLEAMVCDKLRHFIIPSDDRWLHILMDGVPHIENAGWEGESIIESGSETLQ